MKENILNTSEMLDKFVKTEFSGDIKDLLLDFDMNELQTQIIDDSESIYNVQPPTPFVTSMKVNNNKPHGAKYVLINGGIGYGLSLRLIKNKRLARLFFYQAIGSMSRALSNAGINSLMIKSATLYRDDKDAILDIPNMNGYQLRLMVELN